MTRALVRLVTIDSLTPIARADAIETAHIGGWPVVVRKGTFRAGDLAVYFEIDGFLPDGNPAWQFLVDAQPTVVGSQRGHVLRSVVFRGQVSQGLLLSPASLKIGDEQLATLPSRSDLTQALGVSKYEKPLPLELQGTARGYLPRLVPRTDEARIQNVFDAVQQQVAEHGYLTVEVSEKLEGSSCTFALLENDLHVCSRTVDLEASDNNVMWRVARQLDLANALRARFDSVVLQGELIGPGVEGNHYRLTAHEFRLFRVYLPQTGQWLDASARRALARSLGMAHVPIVDEAFRLDVNTTCEQLLRAANGPSALNPLVRREGLVYKSASPAVSFKAISNAYLLNQPL